MNYVKRIGLAILYFILTFLIISFFITILNYINILSGKTLTVIKILVPIISTIISSIVIGKRSLQKGWLEGIKFGLILILLLVIFNFLALNNNLEIKNLLFYIIILISSITGSTIGINIKKNE